MKKILITVATIAMLTGCTNLSDEQKAKITDLVIQGVSIAEQVYIADKATPKDEDYSLENLDANGDIAYQIALATKILRNDGTKNFMPDTGQSYTVTLQHFIVKNLEYKQAGHDTTPLCIKRVTVKDKRIVDLMYSLLQEDGTRIEEQCPSCWINEL